MQFAFENKAVKCTEKPNCTDFRVFDKSLFGVNMCKLQHYIEKPFQH